MAQPQLPARPPGLKWGSTSQGPSVPTGAGRGEGQERRPLPPLCPDRSGRCAWSLSPAKARQASGLHNAMAAPPAPSTPSCLPITALPLSRSLHASFPCSPVSFHLASPLFLNSPLSPFYPNPPFSSFLPFFLPSSQWAWRPVFQLFCLRLSLQLSLSSGSVPMSSWSQPGPRARQRLHICLQPPKSWSGSPAARAGGGADGARDLEKASAGGQESSVFSLN